MSFSSLRVGFIGTGRISDLHAAGYRRDPDARIVALCDANPELARSRAHAWGVPDAAIYADYGELLRRDDINVVEILLPHHLHGEAAMSAVAAGKAVSLQKPIARTLDEAGKVAAAAASGIVRVYENFMFLPAVSLAKKLVDDGAIGEPLTIRLKSTAGYSDTAWKIPDGAAAWRQDRARSGGGPLVFDDGHHKFSVARMFMGNAEAVHAWIGETTAADGYVFDAPAIVTFKYPGARLGCFESVFGAGIRIDTTNYAQDDRVEITGTQGVLWINCGHGRIGGSAPVVVYSDGKMTEHRDVEQSWENSFLIATRRFISCLRDGGTCPLSCRDAIDVLKHALAAEESAATGKQVRL